MSLLGRIRFEISKFHVSIQFPGVYGIYTVEPILYKSGTSGTTPNSLRNGPFRRCTDACLIAGTRKAHRLSTLSNRITSCLAQRRISDATDCGPRSYSTYWLDLVCMLTRRISDRTASVRSLRILASQSHTFGSIGVLSKKQAISSDAFLCTASMRQISEVYSVG
jgi:hypothetical protein